jgi:hypothetical protein
MKPSILLPALTALIGFSIAWVAKPSSTPASPVAKTTDTAPARPTRSESASRSSSSDRSRPKEVKPGDFPLAQAFENGPKTRDEARMLRLTEALGLSLDQQGQIISLVEKVQATISGEIPVIEDLAARGKAIEEGLAQVLSPEQLAKFEEIRVRERENRIEVRATAKLLPAIEHIDLSPEQREEVLSRLRLHSKAELQSIPAAASLLFDNSMLPTANKELSIDGVLTLAKMGEPIEATDAMKAYENVQNKRRQEMEAILSCYDGVLTPGQMGQFQADMAEKMKFQEQMREAAARKQALPNP